jgi:hypothetical protein
LRSNLSIVKDRKASGISLHFQLRLKKQMLKIVCALKRGIVNDYLRGCNSAQLFNEAVPLRYVAHHPERNGKGDGSRLKGKFIQRGDNQVEMLSAGRRQLPKYSCKSIGCPSIAYNGSHASFKFQQYRGNLTMSATNINAIIGPPERRIWLNINRLKEGVCLRF